MARRSFLKRPTNSPAICWLSAAEPPLPQIRIFPPDSAVFASASAMALIEEGSAASAAAASWCCFMADSIISSMSALLYQRPDLLSGESLADIAGGMQVEDQDGDVVLHAEREGAGVHELEPFVYGRHVGDVLDELHLGVLLGVAGVDAVHLGGLEDHVGVYLGGAERRRRVGGEIGIAG